MKNLRITLSAISIVSFIAGCEAQIPNQEAQINGAVQAGPEETRDGATVMGYNDQGELVVIRKGTNEMICLADDPNKKGFSTACYHKDLDPFMARGRVLKAEGKKRNEIFDIREKEAKEGVLKMPDNPTTLHILYGNNAQYNPDSARVIGANYRSVVYIPFATAESTGLPLKPLVPGGPWLMDPGTHKAHIMITPVPVGGN